MKGYAAHAGCVARQKIKGNELERFETAFRIFKELKGLLVSRHGNFCLIDQYILLLLPSFLPVCFVSAI